MTLSIPIVLVAVMVVLFAVGVYLLLDRSLTRVLLGFLLGCLICLYSFGFGPLALKPYGFAAPSA